MRKMRLVFAKTAVHISHLDLMHIFQRAFARAKLPLHYTEGFNPHPYLSIALPLPVGVESVCEVLDFGLAEEIDEAGVPALVNAVLPEGLRVLRAMYALRPVTEIAFARYTARVDWEDTRPDGTPASIRALFDGRPILLEKKTKQGMQNTDIVPMIRSITWNEDGQTALKAEAVLAAGSPTLSPLFLEKAVAQYLPDVNYKYFTAVRQELLDGQGGRFI